MEFILEIGYSIKDVPKEQVESRGKAVFELIEEYPSCEWFFSDAGMFVSTQVHGFFINNVDQLMSIIKAINESEEPIFVECIRKQEKDIYRSVHNLRLATELDYKFAKVYQQSCKNLKNIDLALHQACKQCLNNKRI